MRSKTLLLISGFGMTATLCLMNFTFNKQIKNHDELWLLNLICIYVICYSIGYGPVPWILMLELCPRKVIYLKSIIKYLNIFGDMKKTIHVHT